MFTININFIISILQLPPEQAVVVKQERESDSDGDQDLEVERVFILFSVTTTWYNMVMAYFDCSLY